jgi:hypothetical protein
MKVIKYRKSVAFSRFLVALGAVILGLLLIFVAADDPEAKLYRKIMYYAGGIVSIGVFGPMLILLTFVLFKNPTLFSYYDTQKIVIKGKEMKRTDLWKVELCTLPTGILGTKVPAYSVYTKDKQKVNILTYYVLSQKEHNEIFKTLKQYISNHKSAVN